MAKHYIWDGEKSRLNEAKHGVPFSYIVRVFDDHARIEWPDTRHDYQETRMVCMGRIDDRLFVCVYTRRA